jgi:hypothetical protein
MTAWERSANMKKEKRLRDELDHEDFYDRYHNWPDDPAMVFHPGSAAWKKAEACKELERQRQSKPMVDLQSAAIEDEPNGNVRLEALAEEEVDGNR